MSDLTLKLYNHYQRQGRQDLADAVLNLHKANERYTRLLEMYLGVNTIIPTDTLLELCDYAEEEPQEFQEPQTRVTEEDYEDYAQSFGYDRAEGGL